MGSRRHAAVPSRRWVAFVALGVTALLVPALGLPASAGTHQVAGVKPPPGAVKPVAATGMGTDAALDNPLCNTGAQYGVYGAWSTAVVGAGPPCVVPLKAGQKNGGATATGVEADSVTVVFVHPSAQALGAASASSSGNPSNLATGQTGTYEDGAHDYLASLLPFYESWGRGINVVNYTSSGNDESSQRADAVEVLAMKPFAVINVDTAGLDVFESAIAKGKTLVFGYGTSPEEAAAQAPYRWGAQDSQAAGIVAAELLGKQFVGKKAEFAGSDDLTGAERKLGLVAVENYDSSGFKKELSKYKGSVAVESTYPGTGATFGDATVSAQQAPVIVQRMKSEGVTTVVLFADLAMNKALMDQATAQDWHPEWFFPGYPQFVDYPALAQQYDREQVAHAFGLSGFFPYVALTAEQQAVLSNASYKWFWGPDIGTTSPRSAAGTGWLLAGIHAAGPNLTVKTFQQGLFSMPARGGSATDNPLSALSGFGKTPGLPYDSYIAGPLDFAAVWLDPTTDGRLSSTTVVSGQASWYLNGGKRYRAGTIPTKPMGFFDESASVTQLDSYPAGVQPPTAAPPCPPGDCPSTGATTPTPGSPGTEYVLDGWNGRTPDTGA